MDKKIIHFMYVPFTGLGLYSGWRGDRWFKNRIKIFKQFVVPSLLAQSNRNFCLWISFTENERGNKLVDELDAYLHEVGLYHVFTYSGICFYDDKYPIKEAKARLVQSLHGSMGTLLDYIGEVDEVYMTIQPSDDCYYCGAVAEIQAVIPEFEAVGYKNGYIIDYKTLDMSEYNPTTNPPFYTIKFDRETFADPMKHVNYTSLKHRVGDYPKGIPLPSHEWVKDCLNYKQIDKRGFLVGTHGENISTYFNHPFKGLSVPGMYRLNFGLLTVLPLRINLSIRKKILKKIPHKYQKKLRYVFGEKGWNKIYAFLRK